MAAFLKDKFDGYLGWTYTGVNFSLEGTGGEQCVNYIPTPQKFIQTAAATILSVYALVYTYRQLKLPVHVSPMNEHYIPGKTILLVILSLTFGCELGFKFTSEQMLWVLNPCHIITCIQIYLLMAPASRFTMALFRVQLHWSHGATLALLFPILNTRLLPCETQIYYVQHMLLLFVPVYLLWVRGPYQLEPLTDYSWCMFSCCLYHLYFWVFLQGMSHVTQVNLSNILCPAVSDPFKGQYYQIWAALHQTALILIHGKLIYLIAGLFLPKHRLPNEELLATSALNKLTAENGKVSNENEHTGNGRSHDKVH